MLAHTVRPFRADDFAALIEMMQQTLAMPDLDPKLVARDFLLADGFVAEHLLVAVVAGALVGFLLAPRRDPVGSSSSGWIAAFGVTPNYRRCGVAKTLIGHAVAAMRREGVARIDTADVPVRYLLPGVDRDAFPAAYSLLTDGFGFAARDEVASMGIELAGLVDWTTDSMIRSCPPGAMPLLRDFLCGEFDAGWWEFFRRSIVARLGGESGHSDVICAWENGVPVGAVHYRDNRFGPLAVSAGARGRGLGARLTMAALAGIRAGGFARAHFMVGAADVQPFYSRLGFRTLRRFTRLRLEL